MTRFHIASVITLLCCLIALFLGKFIFLAVTIVIFLVIVSLGIVFPQLRFFGNYICSGNNTKRHVALTFDDGPDSHSTSLLLDLLREQNIAATFFAIGKHISVNHELATRITREGHLLENHSYTHSYATNLFTITKLQRELVQTQNTIKEITGITPQYFRPPMGLSNPRVFRAAKNLGLKVVGWSARGFDTQTQDSQRIVNRITQKLKPGAIILLHDGKINPTSLITTVKILLAYLQEHGYEVMRLDKLLK